MSNKIILQEKQVVETHSPSFRTKLEPLLVLFNNASSQILPEKEYYIPYSIPGGVFGYYKDFEPTELQIEKIKKQIKKIIKLKQDFKQEVLPKEKMLRYFIDNKRNDITHLLTSQIRENKIQGLRLVHMNGHGELFPNHVTANFENLSKFKLFKFKSGFFLIADPDFYDRVMPEKLELSKYLKRFNESDDAMSSIGISSIAELNDAIRHGELPELIKISEAYQAKRIGRIADNIVNHPLKPRVIFLAGPTSSGKTTSANRLYIELKVLRKKVIIISLDNFYLPHTKIPFDQETGIQNFELITALNLDLFRNTINDLLSGKAIYMPKYNFDGKGSVHETKLTQISPDTYIIVEGIHGLNPELWKNVMDVDSYRLYVSALSTLNIHDHHPFSTSEHRLIRRLVRDHLFRGYDFNETLFRWPDVIKNEYQSIFPFQESAHAIFNSALMYEIAVFAHYAPSILIPQKAKNEYIKEQVNKLNRILSLFNPIDPHDIPPTSVLREFIGGSSFEY
ncbi:MAG: uridine kinase family protein [Bacteroidota bacterium]